VLTLLGFAQRTPSSPTPTAEQGGKAILYLSLIALQYGLFRLVKVGLRRSGKSLQDLLGRNDRSVRSVGFDLFIAAVFWAAAIGVLELLRRALGGVDNDTSGLLPGNLTQSVLWVMLSMAAGFSEELFYRGYLQKQLLALSGSAAIAILAQAMLFGISHSYQGIKSVVLITVYGLMFGVLAEWRRSLRPGMIAHALTDIVGGLFKF
jgi:membrane protease YdiL (CAAX protease family)